MATCMTIKQCDGMNGMAAAAANLVLIRLLIACQEHALALALALARPL